MKEKNSKKFLSLLCAGCIAISSVPMLSHADDVPITTVSESPSAVSGVAAQAQGTSAEDAMDNMIPVQNDDNKIQSVIINVHHNNKTPSFLGSDGSCSSEYQALLDEISVGKTPSSITLRVEVPSNQNYQIVETGGKTFKWVKSNSNQWNEINDSHQFELGKFNEYGIQIELEPKGNRKFDALNKINSIQINGASSTVKKNNENNLVLVYAFPKSVRDTVKGITFDFVSVPKDGETANNTKNIVKTPENAPYEAKVLSWKKVEGGLTIGSDLGDSIFEGGNEYEAEIKLTLKPFHDFEHDKANSSQIKAIINGNSVNGESASRKYPNQDGTKTLQDLSDDQASITFRRRFTVAPFKNVKSITITASPAPSSSEDIILREKNDSVELTAVINPGDATNQEITWSVVPENSDVVRMEDSANRENKKKVIKPNKTGEATIIATIKNAVKNQGGAFEPKSTSIKVKVDLPFEVTFNPQGGTIEGLNAGEEKKFELRQGQPIPPDNFPKNPTKDGYRFDGWFTEQNGGDPVDKDRTYNEAQTVYAHWVKQVKVKFNANGGMLENGQQAEFTIDKDAKLTVLPVPTRDKHQFDGWFIKDTDEKVDAEHMYQMDTELVAKWTKIWNITLDANGGTVDGQAKKIITVADGKTIKLPIPSRSGYDFIGWYTKKNGGERVTTDKAFTKDTDLFALWSVSYDSSEDNNSDSGSGSTSKVEKNNKDKMDKKPQEPKKEQPSEKPKADDASKMALEKIEKFQDVKKGDWFYAPVLKVLESGIMNGVSEKEFAPNVASTRAMIVTMLHNLEGKPAVKNASSFKDVKNDQYYANPISWALEQKLVNGVAQDLFAPDTEISREQLATILYHYYLLKNKDNASSEKMELKEFVDSTQVSDYAKEAMTWAVSNKLILGTDKNELNPKSQATRAQTAAIFARLLDLLKK